MLLLFLHFLSVSFKLFSLSTQIISYICLLFNNSVCLWIIVNSGSKLCYSWFSLRYRSCRPRTCYIIKHRGQSSHSSFKIINIICIICKISNLSIYAVSSCRNTITLTYKHSSLKRLCIYLEQFFSNITRKIITFNISVFSYKQEFIIRLLFPKGSSKWINHSTSFKYYLTTINTLLPRHKTISFLID